MSDIAAPLPPYKRIAAKIRAQIESGEIAPGDRLPSARDLMRTEGISSATAARVPAVLRSEGYAITTPGVGTVATLPTRLTAGADRLQLVRAGGTGLRDNERVEILTCELQPAAQDVADALGISPADQVAMRQRRYVDDNGVAAVSATWVSAAIAEAAPEFLAPEPLPKMTFGLIEDRTGRRAVRRRDTVTLRPAPADVAALLDVAPGAPTLVMTNHYWDQDGEPTEYAVDYLGPQRALSAEYNLD